MKCFVNTFKISYIATQHTHSIDNDNILLKGFSEIEVQKILKTETYNGTLPSIMSSVKGTKEYFDLEHDLILIPKNRVGVNNTLYFDFKYLPLYEFATTNVLLVRAQDMDKIDKIIELKSPTQKMDIDLDEYELMITCEDIYKLFINQLLYFTFRNSQMDGDVFDYLLDVIKQENQLYYLEVHNLTDDRVAMLLNVLEAKSNVLRLILYLPPLSEATSAAINAYKQKRPFINLKIAV